MASVALEVGIARHRTGAAMDRKAEAYEVQQQQQAQRQIEAQQMQREVQEQQKLQPQS